MKTALVIDDDIFFCNLLTDILENLDLRVASYTSPERFLYQLEADNCPASLICPDFILTDNQMPGMNGLEFLARIKSMGCTLPDYRIGIISGRWEEVDIETANSLGCQVFDKYNSPGKIQSWVEETRKSTYR